MCKDDRFVSIFLGAWNLLLGPCCLLLSLVCISKRKSTQGLRVYDPDYAWFLYCCVLFITSIIHILSGVLILLGMKWENSKMFFVGIVLGNFLPFALLFTIIIPIIQIILMLGALRYYKSNWE